MTSVTIGYRVETIGDRAFKDCIKLMDIEIPDSVTSMGDSMFSDCIELTNVTIGDGVVWIGSGTFGNCSGLKSISFGNNVDNIENISFSKKQLVNIEVGEKNTKYHSDGNCIINTRNKMLIKGCNKSVIPADGSVTSIGDYAFNGCSGLTSISIPSTIKKINAYAFYGCSGLISITIGIDNELTSIGNSAFENCSGLRRIDFLDTIAEWQLIRQDYKWNSNTGNYTIYCTDGEIAKDGTVTYY